MTLPLARLQVAAHDKIWSTHICQTEIWVMWSFLRRITQFSNYALSNSAWKSWKRMKRAGAVMFNAPVKKIKRLHRLLISLRAPLSPPGPSPGAGPEDWIGNEFRSKKDFQSLRLSTLTDFFIRSDSSVISACNNSGCFSLAKLIEKTFARHSVSCVFVEDFPNQEAMKPLSICDWFPDFQNQPRMIHKVEPAMLTSQSGRVMLCELLLWIVYARDASDSPRTEVGPEKKQKKAKYLKKKLKKNKHILANFGPKKLQKKHILTNFWSYKLFDLCKVNKICLKFLWDLVLIK